jgi:hypothetical protein
MIMSGTMTMLMHVSALDQPALSSLLKGIGFAEIELGGAIVLLTLYLAMRFGGVRRQNLLGIAIVVVLGLAIVGQGILYAISAPTLNHVFWTTTLTIVAVVALRFALRKKA